MSLDRVAALPADASEKTRPSDGPLIAGSAQSLIWASTLPGFLPCEVWNG